MLAERLNCLVFEVFEGVENLGDEGGRLPPAPPPPLFSTYADPSPFSNAPPPALLLKIFAAHSGNGDLGDVSGVGDRPGVDGNWIPNVEADAPDGTPLWLRRWCRGGLKVSASRVGRWGWRGARRVSSWERYDWGRGVKSNTDPALRRRLLQCRGTWRKLSPLGGTRAGSPVISPTSPAAILSGITPSPSNAAILRLFPCASQAATTCHRKKQARQKDGGLVAQAVRFSLAPQFHQLANGGCAAEKHMQNY